MSLKPAIEQNQLVIFAVIAQTAGFEGDIAAVAVYLLGNRQKIVLMEFQRLIVGFKGILCLKQPSVGEQPLLAPDKDDKLIRYHKKANPNAELLQNLADF